MDVDTFEAISKDGVTYLIHRVTSSAPFMTFSGGTKRVSSTRYYTGNSEDVIQLDNGDYMIKDSGVVVRPLKNKPPVKT